MIDTVNKSIISQIFTHSIYGFTHYMKGWILKNYEYACTATLITVMCVVGYKGSSIIVIIFTSVHSVRWGGGGGGQGRPYAFLNVVLTHLFKSGCILQFT